jgi:hypothetical protein
VIIAIIFSILSRFDKKVNIVQIIPNNKCI